LVQNSVTYFMDGLYALQWAADWRRHWFKPPNPSVPVIKALKCVKHAQNQWNFPKSNP